MLEGVREGLLSTGEAGEFLGLGYFQVEGFLQDRGIPVVRNEDDRNRDQADLKLMFPDLLPEADLADIVNQAERMRDVAQNRE